MSEWLGIESAPKDERQILTWGSDYEFQVAIYSEDMGEYVSDLDGQGVGATHWMPLPQPPSA